MSSTTLFILTIICMPMYIWGIFELLYRMPRTLTWKQFFTTKWWKGRPGLFS